ncbi:ABC transporter permease subunit [Streptomyces aurantiogriseus]|uniref:ABC transporter permease n=1 Tax=Streptomyces aurantiogriseus TaxID=66870 RepID=A0A918KVX1_9ACTN|nr:ABC transporter permease subunit [Streptomyces aurantiogriseus]GGR36580.1 hypothetical protein GCM10010251_61230 [Streptomyces aurantiogriseus]
MAPDRAAFVRDGIPLQEAFTTNAALIMALALGAIGALVIVGEYGAGTIRTTFAAVPARHSVMAAKAVVVAVVTTAFGAVAGISFTLTQAILDRRGVGVPIGDPGTWRVGVASALLAPVCALTGLALGTVLRHTAATMVISAVVILVVPLVLTDNRHWSAVVGHTLPYARGCDSSTSPTPRSPSHGPPPEPGPSTRCGRVSRPRSPSPASTGATSNPTLMVEPALPPVRWPAPSFPRADHGIVQPS